MAETPMACSTRRQAELFANQIGLISKMLIEYREVLFNVCPCLGHRGSIHRSLGRKRLGKMSGSGVARSSPLQVAQLHVSAEPAHGRVHRQAPREGPAAWPLDS